MLSRIGNSAQPLACQSQDHAENRYNRNELEDVKKRIEYLYEFKEKLAKLHPFVIDRIEDMLQRPRY